MYMCGHMHARKGLKAAIVPVGLQLVTFGGD